MTKSVLPFLMFQGEAGAALDFYMSVFPDGRIEEIQRHAPGAPGPEGGILRARFSLGGQSVLLYDSPFPHAFSFTPSFSFMVQCDSEAELRRLSDALKDGGNELMPVGSYGFSTLYAWVSDRFGVSWQLNYA